MQHQVPQFIEIEDKIFGPLTAKQFFYLLAGAAIIFIMYVFLQLWLVIILGLPIAGFCLAISFLKLNGIPFIKIVNNALSYGLSNRLYLWRKTPPKTSAEEIIAKPLTTIPVAPQLTHSKLQDLSWSLDIQKNLPASSSLDGNTRR